MPRPVPFNFFRAFFLYEKGTKILRDFFLWVLSFLWSDGPSSGEARFPEDAGYPKGGRAAF